MVGGLARGQTLRIWVENPGGDQETGHGDRDRRVQDRKETACLAFGCGGASCEEWTPARPGAVLWGGVGRGSGQPWAELSLRPGRSSGHDPDTRERRRRSVSQSGCVSVCDLGVVRVSHWCTYTVCARV